MSRMQRRLHIPAALLAVLCAALALLFASTSSPLYATNFWTDTNIYFTIGRGMTRGLAPYCDLFDHKGPLLFMLYALGALISDSSFFGVFLLEVVSLAAALYLGWRVVSLQGEGPLTLAAIPLCAVLTAACAAFNQGGSAEEFCLPLLSLGLLCALSRMKEGARCAHHGRLAAAFGAAMGGVFAIKYTDCGLFFGLGLLWALWELRAGGFGQAARTVALMAAGFLLALVPCVVYLLASGSLAGCVRIYFIENIFDYGGEPLSATGHIYNALAYLRTQSAANPAVAALAIFGCAWSALAALLKREKGCFLEALAAPVGAGLLLLFTYWGEMAHPYYALVFAALVPLGLMPLGALAARLREKDGALAGKNAMLRAALPAVVCAVLVAPLCRALCAATPLLGVQRDEMAQTAFAEIMNREENPTLLDLTSHDQGFYLAAGITPSCRYFADNNLNTEEKREAIAGYLAQGRTRFVVTRYADPGDRYELVAEASSPFDLNDPRNYKLYRLREEAQDGQAD